MSEYIIPNSGPINDINLDLELIVPQGGIYNNDAVSTDGNVTITSKNTVHGHIFSRINNAASYIVSLKDSVHKNVISKIGVVSKYIINLKDTLHKNIISRSNVLVKLALYLENSIHKHRLSNASLIVRYMLIAKNTTHKHITSISGILNRFTLFIKNTLHYNITKPNAIYIQQLSLHLKNTLHYNITKNININIKYGLCIRDSIHRNIFAMNRIISRYALNVHDPLHKHISTIDEIIVKIILLIKNTMHINIAEVWKSIKIKYIFIVKSSIHKVYSSHSVTNIINLLFANDSIHKIVNPTASLILSVIEEVKSYIIPGGGIINDQQLEIEAIIPNLGIYNKTSLLDKVRLRIVNPIHEHVADIHNFINTLILNCKDVISLQITNVYALLGKVDLKIKSTVNKQITNIKNLLIGAILIKSMSPIHKHIISAHNVFNDFSLLIKSTIHSNTPIFLSLIDNWVIGVKDAFHNQIIETTLVYEGAIIFLKDLFHKSITVEKHEGVNVFVLEWDAVPDPDLDYYKVFWGTVSGGPYTHNSGNLGDVLTYNITLPNDGLTWYIIIKAYDTNNFESDASVELSKTTMAGEGSLRSNLRLFLNLISFPKSIIHKQISSNFSLSSYDVLLQVIHALHKTITMETLSFISKVIIRSIDSFHKNIISKPLRCLINIVLNSNDVFNKQITSIKSIGLKLSLLVKTILHKHVSTISKIFNKRIIEAINTLHRMVVTKSLFKTYIVQYVINPISKQIPSGPINLILDTILHTIDAIHNQIIDLKSIIVNSLTINVINSAHKSLTSQPIGLVTGLTLFIKSIIHKQIICIKPTIFQLLFLVIVNPIHKQIVSIKYVTKQILILIMDLFHKMVSAKDGIGTYGGVKWNNIKWQPQSNWENGRRDILVNNPLLLKIKQFVVNTIHLNYIESRYILSFSKILEIITTIHNQISIGNIRRILPIGVKKFITKSEVYRRVTKNSSYFFKTIKDIHFFKVKK